jgi:phosphoglycerol transferase MdoB-like AlkP superfamily enzyme
VFFGVLTVCIVALYLFTDVYARAGLSPDFWSQNRGYRNTGVLLNFCLNTKYITVKEPAGYDADEIDDIIYGIIGENGNNAQVTNSPPNIICIMNESLSDLSVLGDLETNVDYMPFLRSLTENTVRGNLYVPVIGASTSNSEFEFLTGAPMTFFPAGSNAYMLYAKNPLYSLVSTLGAQNYTQLAFHPYYASGWNRTSVYENLGFTRFDSITSVIDYDTLIAYQNSGYDSMVLEELVAQMYPDENVLLRRYVSDSYNYQKVIEMYENRDPNQPFFLFNVTMQNHGSYTEQSTNFTEDVYVTGINGNRDPSLAAAYPKANQYLSLIKASDAAFEELVSYFSQQDEPTVICMFGDHQPNVESELVNRLLSVSNEFDLTTEQLQQQYVTPFYIWANYDIEEKEIERLGANYLSSYLMQVAGVKMPAYNRYLLQLSETIPVINTVGIIDANGTHYAVGKNTPYDDLIADYNRVVYNLIFDEKNRCNDVFTVN